MLNRELELKSSKSKRTVRYKLKRTLFQDSPKRGNDKKFLPQNTSTESLTLVSNNNFSEVPPKLIFSPDPMKKGKNFDLVSGKPLDFNR